MEMVPPKGAPALPYFFITLDTVLSLCFFANVRAQQVQMIYLTS
jgi:hypothetical protein